MTKIMKIYKSTMIDHWKIKSNFLRENIKNIPSTLPLLQSRNKTDPFRNRKEVGTSCRYDSFHKNKLSKKKENRETDIVRREETKCCKDASLDDYRPIFKGPYTPRRKENDESSKIEPETTNCQIIVNWWLHIKRNPS